MRDMPTSPAGNSPGRASGLDVPAARARRLRRQPLTRLFRRVGRLMLLVVLAGLAWRIVRYATGFPFWGDEGFVVMNFLLRDFRGMVRAPLEYGQIAPLMFMWAELAVTRVLGLSEWSMRVLPFLCGAASLVLFAWLARRLLNRRSALLAAAILAASYYPVRHATEVKPYAGDMLISLGLTSLAWLVVRRPGSVWRWSALALLAAIAVWASYPSAFVIGGLAIYLGWKALRRRSWGALAATGSYGLVAAASFAAMYLLYARPHAAANEWYWTIQTWQGAFPPLDRPWRIPLWLLEVHTGNLLAYPFGGNHYGSTFTFLLVVAGFASLWRSRRRETLLLLLAPAAISILAAAMRRYPYGTSARVSLHLAPAFCLLAGAGLSAVLRAALPRRMAPEGIRAAALALGLGAIVHLAIDVLFPYKLPNNLDNRNAVRSLARQTGQDDQWVVANSVEPTDYAPFLEGSDAVVFRYYAMRYSPAPARWAPRPEQIPAARGMTWLIYYDEPKAADQQERRRRLRTYVKALTDRLGQPARLSYTYRRRDRR